MATDRVVDSGGVPIAVRDYGGEGGTIILVPGLAGTLADWNLLAPRLLPHHRVLAIDPRNHGASGDGPWSWDAALDDLRRVAESVGAANPVVVGHSLAGALAVMWGRAHPGSPGVVNLDGHGMTRPDHFQGADAAHRAARRLEFSDLLQESWSRLAGPKDKGQVDLLLAQQRGMARDLGIPEEELLESARRGCNSPGLLGESKISRAKSSSRARLLKLST